MTSPSGKYYFSPPSAVGRLHLRASIMPCMLHHPVMGNRGILSSLSIVTPIMMVMAVHAQRTNTVHMHVHHQHSTSALMRALVPGGFARAGEFPDKGEMTLITAFRRAIQRVDNKHNNCSPDSAGHEYRGVQKIILTDMAKVG